MWRGVRILIENLAAFDMEIHHRFRDGQQKAELWQGLAEWADSIICDDDGIIMRGEKGKDWMKEDVYKHLKRVAFGIDFDWSGMREQTPSQRKA